MKIAFFNPITKTATVNGVFSAYKAKIEQPSTDENISSVGIASKIAFMGNEVSILASDAYIPANSVGNNIPGVSVKYLKTRMRSVFPPSLYPFMPSSYSEIINGNYDVVQSMEFFEWSTILSAAACRKKKIPLVVWHELGVSQRFPGGFVQYLYSKSVGKVVSRNVKFFIPRSHSGKRHLVKMGVPKDKIYDVIPKGIDTAMFSPRSKVFSREALGLQEEEFVILSVGRLVPYKGQKHVLSAFKLFCEDRKCKLVFVGDGQDKLALKKMSYDLGVSDKVMFVGSVSKEKLPNYYSAADVMALPSSDSELFPNFTILESMACGTPVIYSNKDGWDDIGASGLPVEFGNIINLYNILCKIYNPGYRNALSRTALDTVKERYDLDVVAKGFIEAYKEAIAANVKS